jgi:transcriptional regulator with XRE-family HTH domain
LRTEKQLLQGVKGDAMMTRKAETMGERFQRLREEARMTQREASQRSGIPLQTLRTWEQGKNVPRVDLAMRLARTLGVDMNTLLGFEEPPAPFRRRGGKK